MVNSRTSLKKQRQAVGVPGFTLVELLVVISIIGLLISMLLPALSSARASARRLICANNQKQLVLLMLMYGDSYKGSAPWHTSVTSVPSWTGPTGQSGPTNYLTRTSFLAKNTDAGKSLRICPELQSRRADGSGASITGDDYSHYEYNAEVVGYYRSYSSGATSWAIPGRTAGDAPKRLHEFLRPTSVSALADGKWHAQGNTVYVRGNQEFYGTTTRFRLGANSTSNTQYFTVDTVVDYRHGETVNFGFIDGHVQTRSRVGSRLKPGDAYDFGAIADGD